MQIETCKEKIIERELAKEQAHFFIGKEKDFENYIVENIEEISQGLRLPPVVQVLNQKQFRFADTQIKIDIITAHLDDTITFYEVKKTNTKNKQVSKTEQCKAIGQILLYRNYLKEATEKEVRAVLVDEKIYKRTLLVFSEQKLPITLLEIQNDRCFIPYSGW